MRRHADAERLFEEALQARRSVDGTEHPDTLRCALYLGQSVQAQGRLDEAIIRFQSVYDACESDPRNLRSVQLSASQFLLRALDAKMNSARDEGRIEDLGRALWTLGAHKLQLDDPTSAIEDLEEALVSMSTIEVPPLLVLQVTGELGHAFAKSGEFVEAESILLESVEGMLDLSDPPEDVVRGMLVRMVAFYDKWNERESGQGHDASASEWRAALRDREGKTDE